MREEPLPTPEYALFYTATPRTDPICVTVSLNNVDHTMEVDTGATLSVISEETHNSLWSKDVCPPLRPTLARLKTYTGEQIKVMGTISVDVCYNDQTYNLDLNVVKGSGPSLLGRDWMHNSTGLVISQTHPHHVCTEMSTCH